MSNYKFYDTHDRVTIGDKIVLKYDANTEIDIAEYVREVRQKVRRIGEEILTIRRSESLPPNTYQYSKMLSIEFVDAKALNIFKQFITPPKFMIQFHLPDKVRDINVTHFKEKNNNTIDCYC